MLSLIYPMGIILLSWFLLFLLFSGLGMLVLHTLRREFTSSRYWYDSFWLGWAISLVFLQLWHLAFPVNDMVLILLSLVSTVSLIVWRHRLIELAKQLGRNRGILLVFLLMLLWMSSRAIEMPDASDTGYRDIQAVMWMDSYPIVPGLNNLFSSLAYNHSVYLYDALLDVSIWSGRSYYVATGLLLMAFLLYPLHAALQLYRRRSQDDIRWSWIFAVMTIPYILYYTVGRGGITHFLTDTPVDLIGFLLLIFTLDFLQDFKAGSHADYYLIFRIAILVLVGFTIKQTFVVFGLSVAALVFVVWLIRGGLREGMRCHLQVAVPLALFVLITMLPWMVRGVLTSGYIAYPLSIGRVEVDWAEPVELMQDRQQRLATNTRRRYGEPDEVLSSWDWLGPWFANIKNDVAAFALPVSITFGSLTLYLIGRRLQPMPKGQNNLGWWILLPLIIMLVFWFFTFPNLKYVRYIIWGGAGLSVTLAMLAWQKSAWRARVRAMYIVLGLCLLWGAQLVISLKTFPLSAGPDDGFYGHALPPVRVYETNSGLHLNVPHSHIPQCWHIPLPCTPYPRSGLYQRVAGELRHGFAMDQNGEALNEES